jgi:hypothetical protein
MLLCCSLAWASTITTFDAPDAGTGPLQGTFALAINPAGTITGYSLDANFVAHGFVRAADGTIATFDAPGAVLGTFPVAISLAGAITGFLVDANFIAHGFVRTPTGSIVTFDAPGAAAGPIGTSPSSISPEGVVTGNFFDANFVVHGFLRHPNGTITTFDDPNAGTGSFQGTFPVALDPQRAIVGCYINSNNASFGFLRTGAGTFSALNPPGSAGFALFCSSIFSVVSSIAINPVGVITGAYFQPIQGQPFGGNFRGFMRSVNGNFSTFDAVTSPSLPCCTWTFPTSINPAGEIVGFDNDFETLNHGFLRARDGVITLFDAPGAGSVRDSNQGTIPASINPFGVIAGYFVDANNVAHGFSRTP